MALTFYTGKPGGGKSYTAFKEQIHKELVFGSRIVVTNLALKLPEYNEYLQNRYPEKSIDLHRRVRILSDSEIPAFFTIRDNGPAKSRLLTKNEWESGILPDTSYMDSGVLYVIDEAHIHFGARQWMLIGRDVIYYMSQHRKVGDDVVVITQFPKLVDKQFSWLAQEFNQILNWGKLKVGLFKLPSRFRAAVYMEIPTPNSPILETRIVKIELDGLAQCYDTAKGVGVAGSIADTQQKRRGISLWWGVAAIVLVVLALFKFAPALVKKVVKPSTTVPVAASSGTASIGKQAAEKIINSTGLANQPPAVSSEPIQSKQAVYLNGTTQYEGRWTVWLSNGETYYAGDGHVDWIAKNKVMIDGVEYRARVPSNYTEAVATVPQVDLDAYVSKPTNYKGFTRDAARSDASR